MPLLASLAPNKTSNAAVLQPLSEGLSIVPGRVLPFGKGTSSLVASVLPAR